MPIDDVWLTGEPVAGVPDQRLPDADQHVVTTAAERPRNGAQTEYLSRNGDQGSNGANMTPQNRNNGSSNGSHNGSHNAAENGSVNGRGSTAQSFDPTSFDPGPDLPPLPTLRPLPTIRPLSRWPDDPPPVSPLPETRPLPEMRPVPEMRSAPDVQPAPDTRHAADMQPAPDIQPAADTQPAPETVSVTEVAPAPAVDSLPQPAADDHPGHQAAPEAERQPEPRIEHQPERRVAQQPVRHHRRAADSSEPEAAPVVVDRPVSMPDSVRRVLVLGGSGAIGSAVARAMATHGARVAVHHASHAVEAEELVAGLPGEGHVSIGADLADSEAVTDLIRSVDERFGGLDVVINAASAGESVSRASVVGSSLTEWTDAWTGTLTVDVLGAATVAHAAAAAFLARGRGGRIILLAAKGRPYNGLPNPVGIATEQAVGALGSALAAELAPHGIGVIVVGSGSAASSGWSPAALAETVAWLASGPTSALPGAVFNIAG